MIIGLCERFHCLPSALEREDVKFVRMLRIAAEARPEQDAGPEAVGYA